VRAVCDATTLIGLAKIGQLNLLKEAFSEVYIPEAVYREVVKQGRGRPGAAEVEKASWLLRRSVKDTAAVDLLAAELDQGEAETLILGKEVEVDWLILDEEKARSYAASAGMQIIGVVGLLLLAKEMGLISAIKPLLEELKAKKFYVSDAIASWALKKAGEV